MLSIILAIFALWHSSQVGTINASFTNRIEALKTQIRALEVSERLDSTSGAQLEVLFNNIRLDESQGQVPRLIGIVFSGVGVSILLATLIATVVVIRNRKSVESAFCQGYAEVIETEVQLRSLLKLTKAENKHSAWLIYVFSSDDEKK